MARKAKDCKRVKPWKAEVKIRYKSRFLGYFETKEEAEHVEREFRRTKRGHPDPRRYPEVLR